MASSSPASTSARSRRRRDGRRDRSYLLLAVIVVLIAATVVFAVTQLRTDEVAEWLQEHDLLVGLIVVSDPRHRVAFEVLLIDPDTHRAGLLFVPGNVGALIASRNRMDALESIYEEGALQPLRDKMAALLGVQPLFHLEITGTRMTDLVDLLGGVEVFIADAVERREDAGAVLLPAGAVLLDGAKAAAYLSYAATDESPLEWAGRVHRLHQGVLRALGRQPEMIGHRSVQQYLYRILGTNLSAAGFATLLATLAEIDSERMIFQYTIGQPQTVDGRTLVFPHYDGELLREAVFRLVAELAVEHGESTAVVSVEVLNGTSVAGLARGAAPLLQSFGYQVLRIANADHHEHVATVVLDRRGKPELAERVAELMHCRFARTELDAAVDQAVDVTIVLGGDFNGRRCTE
jgi:hypothetical protein